MKKIFTSFVLCILATTLSWAAETTTISFAALYGDATVQPATPVTSGAFSFSFAKGDAVTEPAYFVNNKNKEIRLYTSSQSPNGNSMTINSTTNMTKIVLSGGSKPTNLANLTPSVGSITINAATRTATWTGNATELVITANFTQKSSQFRFATAEITTGEPGVEIIGTPTFSREAGTFYSPFDLTIECTTAGASIYYTLDGSEPTATSTLYNAPIHITGSTTVKAIAIKGDLKSSIATAEYELGTVTEVANIAAYKSIADNTMVRFTNAVNVLAQNNKATYVKDDSGYMYIYGATGQNYKNGDVIPAGFTGKKTVFNGEPELSVYPTDNFQTASGNTPIAPEEIQGIDIAADMFGHYVIIKGVKSFSKWGKTMTDNSGTFSWYNGLGATIPADSTATYNVIGIVGSYRGKNATETIYQLLPTTFTTEGGDPILDGVDIAGFQALPNNANAKFRNNVTVLAQGGRNLYVKDASGHMLVYGDVGQTYRTGDIIPAGFSGVKATYSGEPELKSPQGFQPASGTETVVPEELALTATNVSHNNFAHYILVKSATLSSSQITDANGNTAALYNGLGATLPTDLTKKYDVYAIVGSHYDTGTKTVVYQILPVEVKEEGGGSVAVPEVADINGLYGLTQNTAAKITGNLTAIYQNGTSLYVKDDAGTFGLVFGKLTNTFANGDQIKNAIASWKKYFDIQELIPIDSTFVKTGTTAPVQPTEIALEEISTENVHRYYRIEGATLVNDSTNFYTIDDGTTPQTLFNKFKIDMPAQLNGSKFTVDVFVTIFKNKLELYPVAVINESAPKGDVNGDGNIDNQDVQALIDMILGNTTPNMSVGDISGNGVIDVSDVTALIGIILAK